MPPAAPERSAPIDWPQAGYAAALALLGPPNARLTPKDESSARWGRRGSFWLSRLSGFWHDFETGQSGDVLDLVSRQTGLERKPAFQWLSDQGLLCRQPDGANTGQTEPGPRPETIPQDYLLALWRRSFPITDHPQHPVRLWMNQRRLWPPERPAPPTLRWLPLKIPDPETGYAGRIIALLAPLPGWLTALSQGTLPLPQALQTIAVTREGKPCLDKPESEGGCDKRTLGRARGSINLIAGAKPDLPLTAIHVAEGVADALALRAQYPEQTSTAAGATLGSAGWTNPELARQLALTQARILLNPDQDDAGRLAAAALQRNLAELEANQVELQSNGPEGSDPASLAAAGRLQLAELTAAAGENTNKKANSAASLLTNPTASDTPYRKDTIIEASDLTREYNAGGAKTMAEPITAYCLKLKETVEVEDPQIVQTRNGTWQLKGRAKGTEYSVSKFINAQTAKELQEQLAAA